VTVTQSPYSPRRRTAVLLCGAGTAGIYQAGVLRALAEAGVKIDVVAGHGPGVANALCAAIDGDARMWDETGPWSHRALRRAYRWRATLRIGAFGLLLSVALLLSPLLIVLVAGALYAASALAGLMNMPNAPAWLMTQYQRLFEFLFDPPILPTMMPRAVVLALLLVVGVLAASAVRAAMRESSRRRFGGAFWWRLFGAPLAAEEPGATLTGALWKLVRGASGAPAPGADEISRRYVDVLAENLGQPGFRELLVGVHDVDARRDLVGVVIADANRGRFDERRPAGGPREAEIIDFTGPQRELVVDFLAGALRLPVASAAWPMRFAGESYWRGELHHICDRPELLTRLLGEVAAVGVEQVILVSPAPPAGAPFGLRGRSGSLRGRMGEQVRSIETATFDDACAAAAPMFAGVFAVRPAHNPIGPFDFGGVFDESSDRRRQAGELLKQGYQDAYTAFIDPYVAAGEPMEAI
jgi:hypothetical protein